MLIISFMANNMEKAVNYMNYLPRIPQQISYSSKESMFPPIYQNFGLSINPE
jgi:hypothetical protein